MSAIEPTIESTEPTTPAVSDEQVVAWLLSVGRFYKREKAVEWVKETRARCRPPKLRTTGVAPEVTP